MSMDKDETIKARALDKIEQCVNKNFITKTVFLDTHQQSLLRELIAKKKFGCDISFRGGYKDAERVAMVCVPEYLDPETADIFRLIRVKKRNKENGSGPWTRPAWPGGRRRPAGRNLSGT